MNAIFVPSNSIKMIKVGLLSDTHGYWDDKYVEYLDGCDEIWHAGDIGSPELAARLAAWKPLRAVVGNADGGTLRMDYPKVAHFTVEGVRGLITHSEGGPGRYDRAIRKKM